MKPLQTRWKTALHEAGHICTARALNAWETSCHARIREANGGGGVATLPPGLTPFQSAVATAAGDHAARLPFDAPARRRRPRQPSHTTAAGIRARAAAAAAEDALAHSVRRVCETGNDADFVARYCISTHPENPDEWRFAFDAVHADSRRLVWELRDEIHRIATMLFHRGAVTIPGNPEDDAFFAQGAEGQKTTLENPAETGDRKHEHYK